MTSDTLNCPTCGAKNFAISAYCRQCERPLEQLSKDVDHRRPEVDGHRASRAAEQSSARNDGPVSAGAATPRLSSGTGKLEPVGFWRGFATYVVDGAILVAAAAIFVRLEMLFLRGPFRPTSRRVFDQVVQWLGENPDLLLHGVVFLVILGGLYQIFSMTLLPGTVGRLVTGTALVRKSGAPLSRAIIVVRLVASWLSVIVLGAGFLWAIVEPNRRSFHDLIAGTVLVRKRDLRNS